MESADPGESGSPIPDEPRRDDETVLQPPPAASPVEAALAQFADSIERLSAESGAEMDAYTKGFLAGLREAIKVAANVKST